MTRRQGWTLVLIYLIVAWCLIGAGVNSAFADGSGNCRGNSCNSGGGGGGGDSIAEYGNIDSVISNDVNVGGQSQSQSLNATNTMNNSMQGGSLSNENKYDSFALGISNTLGDVDINDCLGSTQWGTPIFSKQGLVLNKWCAAEVYDAKRLYHMAALTRCQIKEIRKLFEDNESCVAANTVPPMPEPVAMAQEEHPLTVEQLTEQQIYIGELEERLVAIEQRAQRRPATRTVVQQQEFLNDDKKAQLRALIAEDKDEDQ